MRGFLKYEKATEIHDGQLEVKISGYCGNDFGSRREKRPENVLKNIGFQTTMMRRLFRTIHRIMTGLHFRTSGTTKSFLPSPFQSWCSIVCFS